MKCSDCDGEFEVEEAVPVHGTNKYSDRGAVIAHECPMCGDTLSKRFTRERNIENCVHSATIDNTAGGETCSNCGAKFGLYGERVGINESLAIPAEDSARV